MAANNDDLNSPWYPPFEAVDHPQTTNWKRLITEYVWALRSQQSNLNQTVQNFNNNVTQQITAFTQQFANNNGGNNNNAAAKPPVIYGPHGNRLTSAYSPSLWPGYIYVETDRFQASYYSNSVSWILIEGTGQGSFEIRWTGLNASDSGMNWIETSRNNIASTAPFPLYQWNGSNWNFRAGEFYRNQSDLATLAGTFAANNSSNGNDLGARVNVTDFAGQLQWTTANNANGWAWGPDDCRMHGMGPILAEVDPSPTTGWQLYDGSNNVTYLQSTGNTGTVNLPNLSGGGAGNSAFLESGQVNSGINPAVAPILTMNSYTPQGTVPAGSNVTTNSANAVTSVTGVIGLIVTQGNFVTTVSGGGGGGGNLNGTPVTLTGNISNNGQPASLVRRAWFRR